LRLSENQVLRRTSRPKRDEVMGGWRKLHDKEIRNLYSLPSNIRTIKSKDIIWEGHVKHKKDMAHMHKILV
jgi:hypothetical protein